MKPGAVVIAEPPQFDGQTKRRPSVVLAVMPPFSDYLICGISTQLRHFVSQLDEIVAFGDADFATSGLRNDSPLRVGYLMSYPSERFTGVIGEISSERLARLLNKLSDFLRSA